MMATPSLDSISAQLALISAKQDTATTVAAANAVAFTKALESLETHCAARTLCGANTARHGRFAARTLCGTDALQQHGLASLQHGHCAARTLCGTNTAQHEHCAARNALQHEHCATQSGLLILDITAGLHITRGDAVRPQRNVYHDLCQSKSEQSNG